MSHNLSSGIISAAILPFDDNGAIDWKTLERYIIQVAAGDPRAIAMNMAVSEVSSLEVAEQLEVIRRCKATLAGGCTLLSGLNVTHTAAARRSRQAARRCGRRRPGDLPAGAGVPQRAVGVDDRRLPPRRRRGRRRAAARLPDATSAAIRRARSPRCRRSRAIVAIKDASFNVEQTLDNVKEANSAKRKIGVLTGSDTFILEAMLMGCDGALIGFAATATAELVRMHALRDAGQDHRGLRDLGPARPARAHLLAPADPRLSRAHQIRADEAGRAAEFQGARPVPDHRGRGPQGHRPGVPAITISTIRASCPPARSRRRGSGGSAAAAK